MKKSGIIILFQLFLVLSLTAQEFGGGISVGLNASRIDGDGHEIYGKLGLNAGGFVTREIIPGLLHWHAELKYTSRGKYQGPTLTFSGIEVIDLRYVELPLTLQLKLNDKIQVGMGLSPDVLLKYYFADENGQTPVPDYITDPKENFRKVGITGLIEFNYFVIEKLVFGVRFNYSLIPFRKFPYYAVRYRDSGWFHDVLSINARYYFLKN